MKICQIVLKMMGGNEIWSKLRAINLIQICIKMTRNKSKLDLGKMNAYITFSEILPISSQDIERKPNIGINQGP